MLKKLFQSPCLNFPHQVFKKLHLGTVSFGTDTNDEIMAHLHTAYTNIDQGQDVSTTSGQRKSAVRKTVISKNYEAVKAVALCHNVTPVYDEDDYDLESPEAERKDKVVYQASSPDEVLKLFYRHLTSLLSLFSRQLFIITAQFF